MYKKRLKAYKTLTYADTAKYDSENIDLFAKKAYYPAIEVKERVIRL